MNPVQIELMAGAEDDHWWYRGLHDMLRRTLRATRFALPPNAHVLDAGCGTGANLRLLHALLRPAYLGGFDASPHAVAHSRRKAPQADVYLSDLRGPEVRVEKLDLVLSCDAFSIAGIAACLPGLRQLVASLRRGGLLVLHLPAFRWLYSEHDVAIGTRERVTAPQVRYLLRELGMSIELLSYRVFSLFPAIVLARLPSMLRPKPDADNAVSDLMRLPPWTNAALCTILRAENGLVSHGMNLPWGSSVYAVARKP